MGKGPSPRSVNAPMWYRWISCVYNMAAGNDQQAVLLSDGRKWKKSTVTEWKRYGPMRYADCQGSFKCTNESCPFRVEFAWSGESDTGQQG